MKILKGFIPMLFLTLAACGGGGGGGGSDAPAVAPTPDTPPATLTVSGVAATGVALDGASIEVIDGSGNIVVLGDNTTTGADGSYQVELPASVALPVIIRVTPINGGEPLLNLVPLNEGADSIVVNINPITNLVSNLVLGDGVDPTDGSALASALSAAAPTAASLDQIGDTAVQKLLGANVDYDSFANDPDFVAKDSDTPGSAADAILDALTMQAESENSSLSDTLSALNQQAEPAALLEQPEFQVQVVSALVISGNDATTLATQLDGIGAREAVADGEADVFSTIIAVVPTAINDTLNSDSAVDLQGNQLLLDLAVEATVDLIASTVKRKSEVFAAPDSDLVDLLESPSFRATTTETVATAVTPILVSFIDEADISTAVVGLEAVTDGIIQQATEVVASFDYDANSVDVSDLVTAFVAQQVVNNSNLSIDDLVAIQNDNNNVSAVINNVGNVDDVQGDIAEFIDNNEEIIFDNVGDVLPEVPDTWDNKNWDDLNWA